MRVSLPHYLVTEKKPGETPLQALEQLRSKHGIPHDIPMAYAGRLDPMAEGKLLILIGEECKRQALYHGLDKAYEFSVLFGIQSDTGDVLGLVRECGSTEVETAQLAEIATSLIGKIELPYPHFSSKTVHGKPLHVWTLEGRLSEIEIPTKHSVIYSLKLTELSYIESDALFQSVNQKIDLVTPVTEASKMLGRDFRRTEVKATWATIQEKNPDQYALATFSCIASSGTYMRSLAEKIASKAGTCGLAYHIKRTVIGKYCPLPFGFGFWKKNY